MAKCDVVAVSGFLDSGLSPADGTFS